MSKMLHANMIGAPSGPNHRRHLDTLTKPPRTISKRMTTPSGLGGRRRVSSFPKPATNRSNCPNNPGVFRRHHHPWAVTSTQPWFRHVGRGTAGVSLQVPAMQLVQAVKPSKLQVPMAQGLAALNRIGYFNGTKYRAMVEMHAPTASAR